MTQRFDFIAIGGGTAGLTAARLLARDGKRVAVVERDRPGGDCLWTGCVPTKSLLYAAKLAQDARTAGRFGVNVTGVSVDYAAVRAHIAAAQQQAGEVDSAEALRRDRIELVRGAARFLDPHALQVGEERYESAHLLIATGSRAVIPPIEGAAGAGLSTNVEALDWPDLPASLAIVGGGPIGIEFAQGMVRLGVSVTVLESSERLLDREDPQASAVIRGILEGEGVEVVTGVTVTRIEANPRGKTVSFESKDGSRVIECERLLVAAGRRPQLDSLGLEAAGVKFSDRGLVVDGQLRTSQPHIFGAGDVVGGPQFTHVAEAQSRLVANVIRGRRFQKWNERVVPRVTYTDPEVASVGLSQKEATGRFGRALQVLELPLSSVDRAITSGQTEGFFKVFSAPGWTRFVPKLGSVVGGEIVGASLVAPNAGDLLMPLVVAMRAHLPYGLVAWNMQAYPTLALGLRQVLGEPLDR